MLSRSPLSTARVLAIALLAAAAIVLPAAAPAGATPAGPTLANVPAALVAGGPATPLTVALPATPSPDAIRAAILVASAAQRAAGTRGIRVRVVTGGLSTRRPAPSGSVVTIGSGPRAALSVRALGPGRVQLTVTGTGDQLLTAARLLSSPALRGFAGTDATVPAGVAREWTRTPSPTTAPLVPKSVTGRGRLTLTSTFHLPVERQLTGSDPLRLVSSYVSAAGGRVTAHLASGLLGSNDVPPSGQVRTASTYTISNSPTLTGGAVPGWWAFPGTNALTLSASPARRGAEGTLALLRGSRLALTTRPRPTELQLELWPFPLYDQHAWSRTTVALDSSAGGRTLSALVTALANTERITGLPADPQVALGDLSASQATGQVIFAGGAATAAAAGRWPALGPLHPTEPRLAGVLEEVHLAHGGTALLAYGARGLEALGAGYQPESASGRAVLVDAYGHPHTLASAPAPQMFAQPRWPWLAPAAFLAALALGWVVVRTIRARRRLVALPAFEIDIVDRGGA